MSTSQWVDDFLVYLEADKGRSAQTINAYQNALDTFREYYLQLDAGLDWDGVDSDVVRSWVMSMMDRGLCAKSVNRELAALRTFYRYLLMMNRVERNPMTKVAGLKSEKSLPKFFRDDDINRLLDNLKRQADGMAAEQGEMELGHITGESRFERMRAYLVILTLYATGMRIGELMGLRVKDVDFGAMQLKVLGKRNKQRIIPVIAELADAIRQYLPLRQELIGRLQAEDTGHLILSVHGKQIPKCTLSLLVNDLTGTVTTQKRRSAHVFRHTFATSMINAGSDLQSVKELLGHASLNTTQIYTHTNFEKLRSIYSNAHPRG